jgi:hypothetical protein
MTRIIPRSIALAVLAAGAAWAQLTVICTPATLPPTVGTAVSVSCSASGGVSPYTWSISPGTLPAGLSLTTGANDTGDIGGALQNPGPYSFSVQAADSTAPPNGPLTGAEAFEGVALNPVTVTCTLTTGPLEVGVLYSNSCTATGGAQPYTWSIGGSNPPTGLTITTAGAIKYTPSNSQAAYQYTAVATDATKPNPITGNQQFTGSIAPAVTIGTPATLPAASVGTSYSQQFAVTASTGVAPFLWAATGLTGTGLSMSTAGLLSGIPLAAGPVSFMATVTDSAGGTSTGSFSLTVSPGLVISPTSPLPAATVGVPYTVTFTATGGSGTGYTWLASGQPSWLAMNATTGVLKGTPPTSAVTSTFTVQVTDSNNDSASGSYTLPVSLAITTTALPAATIGTPYNQALTAVGGAGGYAWSVTTGTALPSWLQLTAAGALTGTPPATAVDATVSVTVTDKSNTSISASLSLTVTLTITTSGLASAAMGDKYNQTLTGAGGMLPYTWALATGSPQLPPGLTLISSTGVISGLPTAAGQFQFTVQLSDSASPTPNTATKQFTITVANVLSIATTSPLPNATVNTAYSQTLAAAGGVPPYTWSPVGPLPGALAALSLSSTGAITGTPTTTGTGSFAATVTDSAGGTSKQTFFLTIVFVITTPSPLPTGEVNIAYKQNLTASGGATPYTWSLTGGTTLPPGLTLTAGGSLSGIPSAAGTYTFTVQATDSNNITASAALAVTIVAAVSISTPSTLAGGSLSAGYSQTLAASGGVAPYTWTITAGSLPNGLTLSPTGLITGVPTVAGTFAFTATVTDSLGATASRQFTIVVATGLTVTSPPTLPGATVGVPYSYVLQVAGGTAPYTWTNPTGLLPPGLSLKANGSVTGIPTTAGSSTFTVQVTDSLGHQASAQLSITVASALIITTSSLPAGTLGGAYSQSLTAAGGTPPYTWSLSIGPLPGGLALSSAGSITGTANAAGTFSFTIEVTDSAGATATKQLSITVSGGLSITTAATLPNASVNVSYAQALTAAGGTPPYTWALAAESQMPKGLALSTAGAITGTPTTVGTFQFTVTVTDSAANTASQQFTLIVGGLAITTTALPGGKVGASYSQAFTATGGTPPYTYIVSVGKLPPGIMLSSAGILSGTPTTPGSYTFTIQVADSLSATATEQFTIVITGLAITTSALPSAAVGVAYSQTLAAAGGTPPYTWSGTLPAGLTLSAAGAITGTPTTAGTSNVTIQVTDSANATASAAFTLTVLPAPTASFSGLSSTTTSAQQVNFTLALGAAYAQEITGQVTLAFQPDASLASPADDPSILFASGGRTANFTIPANSTAPVGFSVQTGTVAGSITLTVSWQADGAALAVPAALSQTIQIAPAVPVIGAVGTATSTSGFTVSITGYSNTRELSQAVLQFTPASGQTLQTTSLTVSLASAATTWFQSSTSDQYGSQFVLTLPFTVTDGSASSIGSVSVQLVNSVGTSTAESATF